MVGDLVGVLGGKKNGIKEKGIKKIENTVIMFGMVRSIKNIDFLNCALCQVEKSKGKFLYSTVSNPQDCSKRFYTLLLWQTCSIRHHLNFSRKHPAICYNLCCPPLSIARYSFIQLSELEQCRVKKLAEGFNTAAQDLSPLSQESESLPLSHCALQL